MPLTYEEASETYKKISGGKPLSREQWNKLERFRKFARDKFAEMMAELNHLHFKEHGTPFESSLFSDYIVNHLATLYALCPTPQYLIPEREKPE